MKNDDSFLANHLHCMKIRHEDSKRSEKTGFSITISNTGDELRHIGGQPTINLGILFGKVVLSKFLKV